MPSLVGIVGALLGLAGLLLPLVMADHVWLATLCATLGLLCLTMYFIANWQTLKSFSMRRATRVGVNNALAILLFLGIMIIVNFLALRHGSHWDLSETQYFTLAPQTLQVLGSLTKEVSITVFSHERNPGFRAYRDLLESYVFGSPNLTVRFVDPERQPSLARQYNITQKDTAVFESEGQTLHVTKPSETELTGALIRVTRDTKKHIIFLEGHGERGINDRDRAGFSLVKETLLTQGYEVKGISSFRGMEVEKGRSVLVIAGPRDPLTPTEPSSIIQYVQSGGKLFFMIDPNTIEGLAPLLAQWGITVGPGIIVDPQDRLAQGSPTALLVRRFTDHPITHDFMNPILFPVSQGVTFDPEHAQSWEFTPLVQTSSGSWAEMNLEDTTPTLDEREDLSGPFSLAIALEGKPGNGKDPLVSPAMIVVGNSAFASNAYLKFPGNTDFFLNSLAWLAGDQVLLALPPKDPALRPFIPNPTQEQMLLALQVISIPFLLLLTGITVWRHRRRL